MIEQYFMLYWWIISFNIFGLCSAPLAFEQERIYLYLYCATHASIHNFSFYRLIWRTFSKVASLDKPEVKSTYSNPDAHEIEQNKNTHKNQWNNYQIHGPKSLDKQILFNEIFDILKNPKYNFWIHVYKFFNILR